jgi:hypothetical protein
MTTRWGTQDSQPGQLPVERRQVKELLRGKGISSTCLRITRGEVIGRERRMRRAEGFLSMTHEDLGMGIKASKVAHQWTQFR